MVEYKDTYSSTIEIKVYTDEGEDSISNQIQLTEAYPSQISMTDLSWGEVNNLIRVNVNFTFTDINFPLLEQGPNIQTPGIGGRPGSIS